MIRNARPIALGRNRFIVGPFPTSDNFTHILTLVDRFSRWPEAFCLPDTSAKTIATVFVTNWVSRFGCPSTLTTDQGAQFESKLFTELTALLGIHRIRTTAYHPQSNGMVERFHRQLKDCLKARNNILNWSLELPIVLLGIRSAVKEDLKCSPAELIYGQPLRLPGEFFVKKLLLHQLTLTDTQFLIYKISQLIYMDAKSSLRLI